MPLFRSLALLSAFSLSLAGCRGNGPDLTICLLDPVNQELQCGRSDGTKIVVPLPDATNYVCLSPDEFATLVNYMREKCQ
jgi:hypothetical protein